CEVAQGGHDDLGCERQRGDDDPGRYGAVVRPERRAARDIAEEFAIRAADLAFGGSRPVACGDPPAILAIAGEAHGIADRIFLLDEGRLPAVLEIVAAAPAHDLIPYAAEVDPEMRELMREERPRIEHFAAVNGPPV